MIEKINKVEDRVLILELSKTQFDKELIELKNDTKILQAGLSAINESIKQFRNIVIGISIAVVLLEYGLLNSIKLLFTVAV